MRLILLLLSASAWLLAEPLIPALIKLDERAYEQLIDQSRGKVVLVNFWATWCLPCRDELPQLAEIGRKFPQQTFKLVVVSVDEPEDVEPARRLLAGLKIKFPTYLREAKSADGFINAIDPKWTGAVPALFLYDKRGRKVTSFIGETPMKTLETAIRRLL